MIEKDAIALNAEDDAKIELYEVDLFYDNAALTQSSLTFTLSSTDGGDTASKCNNGNYGDKCKTDEVIDLHPWLVIATTGTEDFNTVKVYRKGGTLDGAEVVFYHQSTKVFEDTFGSDSASYTFIDGGKRKH